MERIKLLDYQLREINSRLDHTYGDVEDMILDKYKATSIDLLNSTDYDAIIDDICDFTRNVNNQIIAEQRVKNGK